MKDLGTGLLIIGVMVMGGAMIYQPTVETGGLYGGPGEVYNLGKAQLRELIFFTGLATAIVGAIFHAAGELLQGMIRAGTAKPAPAADLPGEAEPVVETRHCDWCDRDLPKQYRTCTSLPPAQLETVAPRVKDEVCKAELRRHGYLKDEVSAPASE